MPTYEYACRSCSEHLEVVQSFYDDPLTSCPACGGELRKVFGSIGIVFKGSGFYKTDSRAGASSKSTTPSSSSEASTSKSDASQASDSAKSTEAAKSSDAGSAA